MTSNKSTYFACRVLNTPCISSSDSTEEGKERKNWSCVVV